MTIPRIILGMGSANETRHYYLTPLIGHAHTQNFCIELRIISGFIQTIINGVLCFIFTEPEIGLYEENVCHSGWIISVSR